MAHDTHDAMTWGAPVGGLRLGLRVEPTGVTLALENVGERPLVVASHIMAGRRHYDWFTIVHVHDGEQRHIRLLEARNKSAEIHETLEPGATLKHEIDLEFWARLPANGGRALEPGGALSATYEVAPVDGEWSGRLEVGPVKR